MNSQSILYSSGNNDECYTPEYGVNPIIEYINKTKIVWCPFDDDNSNYVKILKKNNITVINSHISMGDEFNYYNYQPENWDIMISNPPFTNKRLIFQRAISFNKPFALLMSNAWLNDSAPMKLFKDIDLQLLLFDKRIKFISDNIIDNKKITFSSSYYCYDFLPKQIIIKSI